MEAAVRLLGPPAVHVGGRWHELPCTKPEAAFVFLASCRSRVRRAALAELLWPEADERGAQVNLRQTLRTLASRPWGTHLGRDRFTVWVTLDSDFAAFDRAVEGHRWAEAHARYAGPFLHGFEPERGGEFGAWVESERAATANRWRRATWAWLEEAHADGRWHDVLGACDRLLQADPLDEGTLRWALRAAAAIGDVQGVTQRYRAFREVLELEVGLAPEPATEALVRELRDAWQAGGGAPSDHVSGRLVVGRPAPEALTEAVAVHRLRPIGRDADIDALRRLVMGEAGQLVTLLAPGGTGKSTLAAAVLEVLRPEFAGEIAAVVVDRIEGPDAVAHAIGRAAGVSLDPAAGFAAQLVAGLTGRRMLLWLDGFEPHLASAGLLSELVAHCPQLHLLVTSRVRLGLVGETVVPVAPLPVALDDAETHAPDGWSPAAQLFLATAARSAGTAVAGRFERGLVEHVCRALGGHPLAIELVAAWTDLMPLRELVARLDEVWDLLRSAAPARSARSADLEGVLRQTWEQLGEVDRHAWARLALMPGSIDRSVAARVGGGWGALRQLADRAVLMVQGERIAMHALLARFGRERAAEHGLGSEAWAAALAVWRERVAVETEPVSGRRVQLHPHDLDQAVGAWHHAVAVGDWSAAAQMATGLLRGLERVGRQRERIACARVAWDALRTATGGAAASAYARVAPFVVETVQRRREAIERAARLARRHRDHRAFALAVAARYRLDARREANADFELARAAFARCGDHIGLAALLHDHGERQMLKGYVADAEALLREARAVYRRLGDRLGEALTLDILTTGPLYRGDVTAATGIAAEARALFEAEGATYRGAGTLATEAWIAMLTGPARHVLDRTETYVRGAQRFGDAAVGAAVMRCGAHVVIGDLPEAMRQARLILGLIGAEDHPEIETVLAHDRLAWGLARTGQPEDAARHLASELALCRLLDAPRWVAQATAAAGALALATSRRREAASLLACAWHHPGLHELPRRLLVGPLTDLGIACPPPRPTAADLDDDVLLQRVEALLEGSRDAR